MRLWGTRLVRADILSLSALTPDPSDRPTKPLSELLKGRRAERERETATARRKREADDDNNDDDPLAALAAITLQIGLLAAQQRKRRTQPASAMVRDLSGQHAGAGTVDEAGEEWPPRTTSDPSTSGYSGGAREARRQSLRALSAAATPFGCSKSSSSSKPASAPAGLVQGLRVEVRQQAAALARLEEKVDRLLSAIELPRPAPLPPSRGGGGACSSLGARQPGKPSAEPVYSSQYAQLDRMESDVHADAGVGEAVRHDE